jgi:hypothetical protein
LESVVQGLAPFSIRKSTVFACPLYAARISAVYARRRQNDHESVLLLFSCFMRKPYLSTGPKFARVNGGSWMAAFRGE